ncbi:MAG: helix-turn-helix transcriptional regulator [Clostridia bacterium]|nr:helix-turn-helix transcriptional regulator [Clostridia bacterium]
MTNTELLREFITKSGLKLEYLAEKCEITRQALSNKITNRNLFTAKEIEVLCRELKIDDLAAKERIFFAK